MVALENWFSFQIFFIFLRETFEISIIVAILLTIIKQSLYPPEEEISEISETQDSSDVTESPNHNEYGNRLLGAAAETNKNQDLVLSKEQKGQLYVTLKRKVIFGSLAGVFTCFIIGIVIISIFYTLGHDLWQQNEHMFEAVMSIFASVVISFMSVIFLRIGKLQEKIRMKMTKAIYNLSTVNIKDMKTDPLEEAVDNTSQKSITFKQKLLRITEKEAIFFLPFITALREGLEAVVFLGGVGIDSPITSLPLSMISAALVSFTIGRFFYKSSTSFSLRVCLVIASCLLYTLASGLMSKGVWQIDLQRYVNKCDGQDMTELGTGPGSYDIADSVWHVNWGGEKDGFWVILTALFGWTNSATYGSVISYNVYWCLVIIFFKVLNVIEKNGYIPFLPIALQKKMIQKRIQLLKHKLKIEEFGEEGLTTPLIEN